MNTDRWSRQIKPNFPENTSKKSNLANFCAPAEEDLATLLAAKLTRLVLWTVKSAQGNGTSQIVKIALILLFYGETYQREIRYANKQAN